MDQLIGACFHLAVIPKGRDSCGEHVSYDSGKDYSAPVYINVFCKMELKVVHGCVTP